MNHKGKIWTFSFTGFIFISAVLCMGGSVIIPVIPNIMRSYGVTSGFITIAFAALIAGRFLASIFTGYFLKRSQPYQVLLAGLILQTITMILLIFARNGLEFSILRFLEGIFEGIVSVVLQVLVINLSNPKDRGIKIGYMQSAFGAGFIVGPLLGTLSIKMFGISGTFSSVILLLVICIVWAVLLHRKMGSLPAQKQSNNKKFTFEFIGYLPFYGGAITQRLLMVAFSILIPLFLVDRFSFEVHQVGIYFTISAIITSTLMPFTGKLGNSKHCHHIVTASLVVMGLSILGMGMIDNLIVFTLLFMLETFGFAVMVPNAMKIFGDMVADHKNKPQIIGSASGAREIVNLVLVFCLVPAYEYNEVFPWILLCLICILLSLPYLKTKSKRQSRLDSQKDAALAPFNKSAESIVKVSND